MTNFVTFSTGGAEAGAAPLERLRPQQKKGGSGSATLIKTSVAELEPEPEESKLFCGTRAIIGYFSSGSTAPETKLSFWLIFYYNAVLRSRHFFGRLQLRKSEVPESTPAPTKLGGLQLQTKKKAAPAPYTNILILSS